LLRHRGISSPSIYARVDVEGLRQIAQTMAGCSAMTVLDGHLGDYLRPPPVARLQARRPWSDPSSVPRLPRVGGCDQGHDRARDLVGDASSRSTADPPGAPTLSCSWARPYLNADRPKERGPASRRRSGPFSSAQRLTFGPRRKSVASWKRRAPSSRSFEQSPTKRSSAFFGRRACASARRSRWSAGTSTSSAE